MTTEVKKFIEQHIDLIENNWWEQLYSLAIELVYRQRIGELTQILLDANIDPLNSLTNIPPNYLAWSPIQQFTIPDKIKAIGEFAFIETEIVSIDIPKDVVIGERAFTSCHQLEKVVFKGYADMGYNAFYDCPSLVDMYLPKDFTMDSHCLGSCHSLVELHYAGTVEDWMKIVSTCGVTQSDTVAKIVHCSDGDVELKN